jgi:poly(3-hydroxyalkanoate) synthetase
MIIATRGNYREIMNLSGNESITEETQFRLALHNRNFDPTYVSIMLTALYKNEKITDKTKNIITEYFENIIQSISIQEFEKIMRNNDVEWVLRLADNTRNKKTQIKLFELINVQCDSHMMETLYSQIIKRLYANKNLSETAIRLMLESEILKETLHNSIQNA